MLSYFLQPFRNETQAYRPKKKVLSSGQISKQNDGCVQHGAYLLCSLAKKLSGNRLMSLPGWLCSWKCNTPAMVLFLTLPHPMWLYRAELMSDKSREAPKSVLLSVRPSPEFSLLSFCSCSVMGKIVYLVMDENAVLSPTAPGACKSFQFPDACLVLACMCLDKQVS